MKIEIEVGKKNDEKVTLFVKDNVVRDAKFGGASAGSYYESVVSPRWALDFCKGNPKVAGLSC